MRNRLAVIGAGDFQNQLIKKAKARGMETHVFAWKSGDIGEREADYFYPISIIEKDQILEKCREIKPAGIVSIASDLAVVTVSYVAEKLNLIGNGMESAKISTNKYLMRKAFEANKDPSPRYCRSDEMTDEMLQNMHLPLIVKPVDRSGSRGVTKITDRSEIRDAVKRAEEQSFENLAVIEEFIEGDEYSVEYISWEGRHTFLALTQKYTTGAPHFIETGHVEPAIVSEETLGNIQKTVVHALDSLLIKYGASHAEIKVTPGGDVKIIEIGARMGGDCIGSDLVQISTGYDFVNMVIDIACGKQPSFEKVCTPQRAEVRFLFGKEDFQRLEELKKTNPDCLYRVSELKEPEEGITVTDSSARYGYYIIRG